MINQSKQGLKIVRHFNAPREVVFEAFANAEAMGEWWGPAGMDLIVKAFDFTTGGKFHYKMEGHGQTMWGLFKYGNINRYDLIEFTSSFSDETGNICTSPFPMDFPLEIFNQLTLTETNGRTTLTLQGSPINATTAQEDTYHSIKDNMQEGFAGTFDKLDRYLQSRAELKNNLRTDNKPRVCTYLNFPGNTEEVLNFYRTVFRSAFSGGIKRLGDFPAHEGQPPLSDDEKKMILHVELPIIGGHVLMATDAPESMGFKVIPGNNMHIHIEPGSRAETKRLFDELSVDGVVEMPVQDAFWGAYYGNFTDKYGINWMLSHKD
ncbi:SRPBCC domain-containing protein [Mucilaginibacter antarcticus]|uniref:SRPBCC domain-containing protein n=1 Tax=Mucilaginibacter antarcticus TaxID=1855725 RepID=A0ABW5XQG3_9SPHI